MPAKPSFILVLGTTNFNKVDELREGWEAEVPPELPYSVPKRMSAKARGKYVGDLRAWSTNGVLAGRTGGELLFVDGSVFGLRVETLGTDGDVVRALAVLHPEYGTDGHMVLPQVELEDDKSVGAEHLRKVIAHSKRRKKDGLSVKSMRPYAVEANRKKKMLALGLNYASFGLTVEVLLRAYAYLCKWLGVEVDWSETRLILVWRWD